MQENKKQVRRKDPAGRVLHEGESYRSYDNRYCYRWTNALGERKSVYARTLSELRATERTILNETLAGQLYTTSKVTLNDLITRYISLKQNKSFSTKTSYKNLSLMVRDLPQSKKDIKKLKKTDAISMLINLERAGYQYGTLSNLKTFLRSVCQMAIDDEIILKNPFEFRLSEYLVDNRQKRQALTEDEQRRFLEYIRDSEIFKEYFDDFNILLGIGTRIGEFSAITISDINLKKGFVSINKQMAYENKAFCIKLPKTKSGVRIVPLSKSVKKSFENKCKSYNMNKFTYTLDGYTGFLFSDDKGCPITGDIIRHRLDKIVDSYNKEHPDMMLPKLSPHILRHSFSSRLAGLGVSTKSLQTAMGHSNVSTTFDIYSHIDRDVYIKTWPDGVL